MTLPRNRGVDVAPLLARLEHLATDNGRLSALTEVAESTERRLTVELVEQRARVIELELEAREAELAAAGPTSSGDQSLGATSPWALEGV